MGVSITIVRTVMAERIIIPPMIAIKEGTSP
jgi:hypothetical protein